MQEVEIASEPVQEESEDNTLSEQSSVSEEIDSVNEGQKSPPEETQESISEPSVVEKPHEVLKQEIKAAIEVNTGEVPSSLDNDEEPIVTEPIVEEVMKQAHHEEDVVVKTFENEPPRSEVSSETLSKKHQKHKEKETIPETIEQQQEPQREEEEVQQKVERDIPNIPPEVQDEFPIAETAQLFIEQHIEQAIPEEKPEMLAKEPVASQEVAAQERIHQPVELSEEPDQVELPGEEFEGKENIPDPAQVSTCIQRI